jgi:hypothetical protein
MKLHRHCAILLLAALPFAAQAATLSIDGKFGNKDGCAYAKTGESTGSDDFFLLTPEAMTTATAYCEVKTVGKTKGDTTSVVFGCQAEGEDSVSDSPAKLIRAGKNAYKVTFDDGTVWGPLKRCR